MRAKIEGIFERSIEIVSESWLCVRRNLVDERLASLFAAKNQRDKVTADHQASAVPFKLFLLVESENLQQPFEIGGFRHRHTKFYSSDSGPIIKRRNTICSCRIAAQSHVDSLVQVSFARQSHDWNIISVLLVDEFAADPCLQHLNIFELFRRNNEDVAINDDKIGQFADLQRSLFLLLEADIGGIACEQLECLEHGKPFLRR